MVTKMQKPQSAKASGSHLGGAVKDSAQQIWLAGLGAFAKAQAEGGKVFETLAKEGLSIQRKTQTVAEEKIAEATSRMSSLASDIGSKATGQWDKIENIFEDRVAKALNKLGVPSARDIDALVARIDELNKSVAKLSGKAPATAKVASNAAAKAAPKAATKAAPKAAVAAPAPAAKRVRKTSAK